MTAMTSMPKHVEPNYSLITFLLFWCALIVVSSVYVTTPLIGVFVKEFQVTQTTAAWTGSIFSLFYAVGFLVLGPLADRYGRKQMIVFGLGVLSLVTFAIGFVNHLIWLIILRALQGFISAAFAPAALAYVFDVFPKRKLVTTIGFTSFGFLTAGIFGQVVAGFIDQTFDWHFVFILFGGLYLVSLLAVAKILPTTKSENTPISMAYHIKQVKKIFAQKNFRLCYVITIMLLLTFIGMYTALGDYLKNAPFYLRDKEILYVRTAGLAGMILSPFTGFLAKKLGLLVVLRVGLAVSVGGLVMLGVDTNLPVIICMSVVYVAGISLTFPAIMTLIGEWSGNIRAIAASIYTFILFIGASLGPIVTSGLMQTGSFFITFVVLAILLSGGLVASFFIRS
ncbi:Predicted arabinose efflux permease, MFS family [Virgibacillus salinus]|uniref:Predicted arabinose efflux permease, MFS family n=2 Tax=Virgibacillus salinus TaxID=553311 RepID=A0A1H1FSC0_9BACI|nr:Predicted arabinose efflux permease, MFS family [Virgibacillus salinus]